MFGMSEEAACSVNDTYMLSIRLVIVEKLLFTRFVERRGLLHSEQSEMFSCLVETEEPLCSGGEVRDLYRLFGEYRKLLLAFSEFPCQFHTQKSEFKIQESLNEERR